MLFCPYSAESVNILCMIHDPVMRVSAVRSTPLRTARRGFSTASETPSGRALSKLITDNLLIAIIIVIMNCNHYHHLPVSPQGAAARHGEPAALRRAQRQRPRAGRRRRAGVLARASAALHPLRCAARCAVRCAVRCGVCERGSGALSAAWWTIQCINTCASKYCLLFIDI